MQTEHIEVGQEIIRTHFPNGRKGAKVGQVATVIGFKGCWPVVDYEGRKEFDVRIGEQWGEVWCPAFCELAN